LQVIFQKHDIRFIIKNEKLKKMKSLIEYKELTNQLDSLTNNWENKQGLDASFFAIVVNDWRLEKSIGAKKDCSYGWIFYSTSTNSDASGLSKKLYELIQGFQLGIVERQL
jgi:hypothetical protein